MSHQLARCAACRAGLEFRTDGNGVVITECPHCDWGWPLSVCLPMRDDPDRVQCPQCEGYHSPEPRYRNAPCASCRDANALQRGRLATKTRLAHQRRKSA